MIRHAFKEWAVICKALAEGRQSLILRKGGVAEEAGVFRPEHPRFWLFPTFAHQQAEGIKPEALPLLRAAEAERPAGRVVRLSHFVDVGGVFFVRHLDEALAIDKLHLWSEATVRQRFAYRTPGLYILAVRVYQVPKPFDVPLKPEYDGCKTWVALDQELSTDGAVPVVEARRHADLLEELERLLNPTALA